MMNNSATVITECVREAVNKLFDYYATEECNPSYSEKSCATLLSSFKGTAEEGDWLRFYNIPILATGMMLIDDNHYEVFYDIDAVARMRDLCNAIWDSLDKDEIEEYKRERQQTA